MQSPPEPTQIPFQPQTNFNFSLDKTHRIVRRSMCRAKIAASTSLCGTREDAQGITQCSTYIHTCLVAHPLRASPRHSHRQRPYPFHLGGDSCSALVGVHSPAQQSGRPKDGASRLHPAPRIPRLRGRIRALGPRNSMQRCCCCGHPVRA